MESVTKNITVEDLQKISRLETFSKEELLKISESIKELALLLNLISAVDPLLK